VVGVQVNKSGTNAPYSAQLDAYKGAMWGGFAFGLVGALLAALFLRHVGIVGHRPENDLDEEQTAHTLEGDEKKDEKKDEQDAAIEK
jgi:hypothetical protein